MGEIAFARDAERYLLAATFQDNSLALSADVSPQHFGDTIHQRLWSYARDVVGQGRSFSVAPICEAIPQIADYVRAIADYAVYAPKSQIIQWVQEIRDADARRRLTDLAHEMILAAGDIETPPEEIITDFVAQISRVQSRQSVRSKRQVAQKIFETLTVPAIKYKTGLDGIDRALGGGLYAGKLIGIAARKKIGKTVLLGSISHNLNAGGVKHGYLALEMSDEEIEQRNVARELGFNSIKFLKRHENGPDEEKNKREQREEDERKYRVSDYAVTVPDFTCYEHMPGATFNEVRRAANHMVSNHDIKGLILDYWQLVSGKRPGENEEYHLRTVAQWQADFCRKHKIFGITAAQVNQDGNTRGGEGLKLACDIYFTLHREKDSASAWMEMEESRYVLYTNVGSKDRSGLIFDSIGPYFRDPKALEA